METPAPSRPAAPAVVAVMVTRNPGPWFDEALRALEAQDYSNLAVLVIDAASDTDPTPRVASVLPQAYVRRLEENRGFGASANHVQEIVDGAAFYCFLHDDAAPTESAITTMVGEAVRSNAGVVGAKLVQFADVRRLLQVGESADKTGERATLVEPGELDQEQHDAVRDVFVVPGGCTLVRSDLFDAIGGFDPGIDVLNDDLNLCWRAHVAGARVVVAPDAVVRHAEALGERVPVAERRERLIRHRVRTMLSCYSRWHLVRVLPQAVLVAVLEVVYSILVGRRGQAGDVVRAWRWNLRRRDEIREWRARVEEFRRVPDSEVRRFQLHGSARFVAFIRGQTNRGGVRSDRAQSAWRSLVDGVRSGELRIPIAAWAITLLIVGFGSRHLLFGPIAAVGGFPEFDAGPVDLVRAYLSGWRDVGLGTESPAPTALGLLGGLGGLFLGAMGMLRRVLLLGPLLLGLVGAYRLVRPTASPRAQAVALVVYGAIPLAYDSLAEARWGAITIYGVTPWLLGHLARSAGWAPFGSIGGDAGPGVGPHRSLPRAVSIGLIVALAAAVDPSVVPITVLVVAGLALGSVIAGSGRGSSRLAVVGVGGVVVAIVLHVPWAFDFILPGADWGMVVGHGGAADVRTLPELLRFDVGPVGASALSIGLPLAALLPLLIGRGWRFDWAVRAWTVALICIGVTWASGEGWLPVAVPPAEAMLAPAAAAFALAVAMGVVAFEVDLRAYGFGWRQVAAAASGVALLIGALPTLLDAGNGRWYLPAGDLESTFAFFESQDPGFRVLWIGDRDVLPVDGFPLAGDLVYATTDDGLPGITDQWAGSGEGPTQLIEDALGLADAGETSRLGRLLAPMAIRYVVVVSASAPRPLGGLQRPVPASVTDTFAAQLDLSEIPVNPSYTVYRNEVALPARSVVAPDAGDGLAFDVTAGSLDGAVPVLEDQTGPTTFEGPVDAGARVLHSAAANDNWELLVEGRPAPRSKLFGWADGYDTDTGGAAVLRYDTSPLRYAMVALQLLFWVLAVRFARRLRRAETIELPAWATTPEATP